jgi:hypothetical protein
MLNPLKTPTARILAGLAAAALGMLSACGNGTWGAELSLSLSTADASALPLSPGASLPLPDTPHRVVVQRACLTVETVVISPAQPDDDGGGGTAETCFCHGDPPHCHGDCEPTEAGAAQPLIRTVHQVVDLLGGSAPVVTGGVAPGAYDTVTLSLSKAPSDLGAPPAACAPMEGRTFWLEGTLETPATGESWPLTIDLRVTDKVTEPVRMAAPVEATAEGGPLGLTLRLDRVLAAVDWAGVTPDAQGQILIGGTTSQHIIAVGALVQGLQSADSYTAPAP